LSGKPSVSQFARISGVNSDIGQFFERPSNEHLADIQNVGSEPKVTLFCRAANGSFTPSQLGLV